MGISNPERLKSSSVEYHSKVKSHSLRIMSKRWWEFQQDENTNPSRWLWWSLLEGGNFLGHLLSDCVSVSAWLTFLWLLLSAGSSLRCTIVFYLSCVTIYFNWELRFELFDFLLLLLLKKQNSKLKLGLFTKNFSNCLISRYSRILLAFKERI